MSRTSSAQSNLSLFLERGPSSATEGEGELEGQSSAPRAADSADVSLDESFGKGMVDSVFVCIGGQIGERMCLVMDCGLARVWVCPHWYDVTQILFLCLCVTYMGYVHVCVHAVRMLCA